MAHFARISPPVGTGATTDRRAGDHQQPARADDRAARRLKVRPDASQGSPFGKKARQGRPAPDRRVFEPMPPRAGDTAARGECRQSATR